MAWRGSRARGVFRAPACIVFSRERPRLRSPVAAVRQALVRMLTWPVISAGKSKRPTMLIRLLDKCGRATVSHQGDRRDIPRRARARSLDIAELADALSPDWCRHKGLALLRA